MFGCPGCFSFEPQSRAGSSGKADYINFVRIPAQWRAIPSRRCTRAPITRPKRSASSRRSRARSSTRFHTNRNLLDTEAKLAAFFAKHGVDEATFKSTFNSFAVNAKVKRADELMRRYRVQSTPTIIVNGKYSTGGQMAGSYEAWFAIIDDLAAREHAAAGGASHGAVAFRAKVSLLRRARATHALAALVYHL